MTDKNTITVELIWDIEDSMMTGITMDEADKICSGADLNNILNLFARSGMAKSVKEAKAWKSPDKAEENVEIAKEFTKLKHDLELREAIRMDAEEAERCRANWSSAAYSSPIEVKYGTPPSPKTALCFDFDGVIHSFVSGWIEADIIPDEPVEGIKNLLTQLAISNKYVILIFSSRCGHAGGVQAVEDYMRKWGLHYDKVCEHKPNAALYIDDLGYRFTSVQQLKKDLEVL